MSSALPSWSLVELMDAAENIGLQGLELCVFRRDGTRRDHVATHLEYEKFDTDEAKRVVETFQKAGLRFSIGAYENLIGGDETEQLKNQNHLLHLIRMAAMMGGRDNGIHVGTFVGYNHRWDADPGSFAKNLEEYRRIFAPIIGYAEDLGVDVLYENCPMEGWRSSAYSNTMNNLPSTLAARKFMYTLIPSRAHGEIYDPSHDIWQFVDPVEVLKKSDLTRIKAIHLKATRLNQDDGAVHWGHVFGKQAVPERLAAAAGVPIPAHDWDRFSYEPMVPGFGGSDSMDWRRFIEYLMERGYDGPLSIENEGANSRGTGSHEAVLQGFEACLGFVKPLIWSLDSAKGYSFSGSKDLSIPANKRLPSVTMKDLTA